MINVSILKEDEAVVWRKRRVHTREVATDSDINMIDSVIRKFGLDKVFVGEKCAMYNPDNYLVRIYLLGKMSIYLFKYSDEYWIAESYVEYSSGNYRWCYLIDGNDSIGNLLEFLK